MAMKATVILDVEDAYQTQEDAIDSLLTVSDMLIDNAYGKGWLGTERTRDKMLLDQYALAVQHSNAARMLLHQLICHSVDPAPVSQVEKQASAAQRSLKRVRTDAIRAIRKNRRCSYYIGCTTFDAICDAVPEIRQYREVK
jgi:hypothetical protein